MDSLSQAVLGGAVGEAVLGGKIGNKAVLWGALLATLPDLDVLAHPFIDEVTKLSWHRGYSHSLIIQAIAAPIFGWLLWRLYKRRQASLKQWSLLALLALWTHSLLDLFTVYGTQLFRPISSYPFGLNSISIIDPMYTVPLLIGLIAAMVTRRNPRRRRLFNAAGLTISTAYLFLAFGIKLHVGSVFATNLGNQKITYERYMTTPTMFNALLWRCTADLGDKYVVGYYSVLDDGERVSLDTLQKNRDLLPDTTSRAIDRLLWFSQDWYALAKRGDTTIFYDLRFGKIEVDSPGSDTYIFSWALDQQPTSHGTEVTIAQQDITPTDPGRAFDRLIDRIQGTH